LRRSRDSSSIVGSWDVGIVLPVPVYEA